MDETYHSQFEEALQEGSMLLHLHHPAPYGMATEGDLPNQCQMIDGIVHQLEASLGPLLVVYMSAGNTVEQAQHRAMESLLHSALEIGFATGRVFQSHGYNVPMKG